MGAASTVPVDGTKPLDIGAQPKNVFSGSVSKIQEAENKVRRPTICVFSQNIF
jgi:hypothetical protein